MSPSPFTNTGRQGKNSREIQKAFQIQEILDNQVFWLIIIHRDPQVEVSMCVPCIGIYASP